MSLNHDIFVGKWYKSFLVECLIEIIGNSGTIFLNLHSLSTLGWQILKSDYFQNDLYKFTDSTYSWKIQMNLAISCHSEIHDLTNVISVQVNLCQKPLFLHQLTHNMTTDCSVNYQFSTWKFQALNMERTWVHRTCCAH